MGTRAILIIDNEAKTPNVFYAQYAIPAFKIPALTRWIVAVAREGRELTAEDYAVFAEADEADHFREHLGETLTVRKACREWANSDIEYLYYIGPESAEGLAGNFVLLRKEIGAKCFDHQAHITWTQESQAGMHEAAVHHLKLMRHFAAASPRPGMLEAIDECLQWHAARQAEDAKRSAA